MIAAVLAGCGAVWWFGGYEGRVDVERDRLRREIVVLGMVRERQAAVVFSAEERAAWAAIHDEEIRDYEKLRGRGSLVGSGR